MNTFFNNKKQIVILMFLCLVLFIPLFSYFYIVSSYNVSDYNEPIIYVYRYVSTDYGFADIEIPQKGRNLDMIEALFEEYKTKNNLKHIELCIATKPTSSDDLSHRRWKYKYIEALE